MAAASLGRIIIRSAKRAWKHRRTIGKVGSTILTAGTAVIEKGGPILEGTKDILRGYKFCREDEKHIVDNPLAENKWVIARKGERCRICTRKTDRSGNPIPGTERRPKSGRTEVDPVERRSCTGMRRMALDVRKSSVSVTSTRAARRRRRLAPKSAVCINNSGYPASLELHKIYRVVSDEEAMRQGDLRIVDESGDDYLYPAAWFVPLGLPPRVRGSLLRSR